jgi:pimeloyl-ACP methyl ester carboxylesterase
MAQIDMIEDAGGRIDYEARGAGPTVVLVPGSCSTGAAWRPVLAAWGSHFRCVTTSLLGYGGTAERRSASDPSIGHEVDIVEAVIRQAGGLVHLVGHSFGGLVAIAVALRNRVPLASLAVIEAPAAELLRDNGDREHYRAIRQMTDDYFAAFANGNVEAIATMIDFYGGAGTFASWPRSARLRPGNHGRQRARLGERLWVPTIRGRAGVDRYPRPGPVGATEPPGGTACQCPPRRLYHRRGRRRGKDCRPFHDCNARR